MKRIWHPYTVWEDYINGMWRTISGAERQTYLDKAIAFTGDAELYGSWMLRVLDSWPVSCEQNLSDVHQNRKAWIGHAACCLAIGCPEDVTRAAWGELTKQQQDDANAKAQVAIETWEARYARKDSSLDCEVGETGVPERLAG